MFGIELAKGAAKRVGRPVFDLADYLGKQAHVGAVVNIMDLDAEQLHATVESEVIELGLPNSEPEAEAIATSLAGHLAQLHERGGQFKPVTQTEHQTLLQVADISGVLIDGQTINIPRPRNPM